MSRRWLTRLILSSAPLFGAIPLLAQGAPAAPVVATVTVATFPYGRYVPKVPGATALDTISLVIEFKTDGVVQMYSGGRPGEMHLMAVRGDQWMITQLEGGCGEADGRYKWIVEEGVLRFELIEDACAPRAQQVTAIRLVKFP